MGAESTRDSTVLEVRGLNKSFGHVRALRDVDFSVLGGQVTAIVGDNGAGKSTLIKVVAGAIEPDSGEIAIGGEIFKRLTPSMALKRGVSTVYQDLALVECLDSTANLFLGRELLKAGVFLEPKSMHQESRTLLEDLEINVPSLRVPVSQLSGGQRQAIAIARAIHQGGRIIILDEPTAAMGVREAARVSKLVVNLATKGYAVVVISHNLHQVFEISQRICVMRQGALVADFRTADTDPNEVVRCITGSNRFPANGQG